MPLGPRYRENLRRLAPGHYGSGASPDGPLLEAARGFGGWSPNHRVFVKQKHIWLPGNPAKDGAATEPPRQAP